MEFSQTLSWYAHDPKTILRTPVTWWYIESYPILFFSYLRNFFQASHIQVTILSPDISVSTCMQHLSTTFLGQVGVYIVRFDLFSTADKKKLESFFSHYSGPHIVMVVCEKKYTISYDNTSVAIDTTGKINLAVIESLIKISALPIQNTAFIMHVINNQDIYLDQVIHLMQYYVLLGRNYEQFNREWLNKIMIEDQSLFVLSQYFFEKKMELFFMHWTKIKSKYTLPFWTMYWSENIYRASMFQQLMSANNRKDAKHFAYRLPFSYTKSGWKRIAQQELYRAHHALIAIDRYVKLGIHELIFDQFYLTFLLNQYR